MPEKTLYQKMRDIAVPGGTHRHWVIPSDNGKGVSIEATNIDLRPHHRVRLTRVR